MARFEEATKRLQAALERMEQAIDGSESRDDKGLRAALESALQENAALQEAAAHVSSRLDVTIDRLKSSLEL